MKPFFRLMHRSVTVLILGAILISTVPFYGQCRSIVLNKIWDEDIAALSKIKNAAAVMENIGACITDQIFNDPNIAPLLYGREYESLQFNRSMMQLSNYRTTMPWIESIYAYNGRTGMLAVSSSYYGMYGELPEDGEGFFDPGLTDIIRNDACPRDRPIPRNLTVTRTGGREEISVYTFLRTNALYSEPVDSAVFVNFSYGWLEQMLESPEGTASESIIVDGGGSVVSNGHCFKLGADVSDSGFFKKIISSPEGVGSFVTKIKGEDYMVASVAPDDNDWYYIRLAPYKAAVSGLNEILRFTVVTVLLLVAAGAAVTYGVSRFLYKPIGKVTEQVTQLTEENRQIHTASRRYAVRSLLLNEDTDTGAQLLSEAGILTGEESRCRVVLIRLGNYRGFVNDNSPPEQSLIRRSVLNCAVEIFSAAFPAEAADRSRWRAPPAARPTFVSSGWAHRKSRRKWPRSSRRRCACAWTSTAPRASTATPIYCRPSARARRRC